MPGLHVIEVTATVLVPHPKPTPVQIAFGIRSVDETDVVTDSLTGLAVQIQASFKAKNDFFFFGMSTMVMLVLSYKPPISLHIQTNMF